MKRGEPYLKDLVAHGHINRGLALLVFGEERRMPSKQESKAVLVAILGTEVRRRVPINVLGVEIGPCHQQGLDHSKVASDACDVKWCTEVLRP